MAKEKNYNFNSEDSRNATLLVGVLLIAVLLVGGGLLYVIMNKGTGGATTITPPQNQTGPNLTNQTAPPACDAACLYRKALSSGDPAMCANLSAAFVQQCYEAMSNASLVACEAVANGTKKQSCLVSLALAGGNLSLCDLAADRTACRRAVDPCAESADVALCHALDKNDPSLCNSDALCLLNYSSATDNSSVCGLIQDPVITAACTATAKRTDSCSSLALQSQRDYCYELYAIYTNNPLVCTQTYPDSSYSFNCFSYFAASMHDYAICKQDGLSLNSLWACYINYSLATGDLAGCTQIDPLATTNLYACASKYAQKFGDPAACEIITKTLTMRSTCYEGAIIYSSSNLNWSYCAGVTDFNWRNACYTQAAKLDKDPSICNYASPVYAVQSCKESYAANQTN